MDHDYDLARPGAIYETCYETCGHEGATLRDYGAGGFMLVCDPCDAESEGFGWENPHA
jgi:hypothetical protein